MSKPSKKPFYDDRLFAWPPVFEDDRGMHLEARVLTPSRFHVWRHLVLEPSSVIWRLVMGLLVIDGLLTLLRIWTVFAFVPCGRTETYIVMGALFLLWHLELGRGYSVARFVLGKHLFIGIEGEYLVIGGGSHRYSISLSRPVTFGVRKFDMAKDEAFKHSVALDIIIDQIKRIPVIEVFDASVAEYIVTNANLMIMLGGEHSLDEVDIDPNRFDDEDWH